MRAIGMALLVAAGCGAAGGGADAGPDADPFADPPLGLSDVTALSPDLAAAPYGGSPGWDATDKYAPGVALVDFDGDGALDLAQPRNDRDEPELRGLRLYRGLGDGRFAAVAPPPWDEARNGTAALAFDYDGDEDLDLFVGVDGGPSALYRNEGGFVFTEVAEAAGVAAPGMRVVAAAAGDVDGDGDPDLYLGAWNASAPAHGDGTAPNRLYRNDGDGTFTDVTAGAGVECHGWATLGLALADLDDDGDLEIFVANDFFPACLYENLGDGTFVDVAAAAGVHDGALNGMGVAVGDLDGDLDLDVMVTDDEIADSSYGNAVYLGEGGGRLAFTSEAAQLGLGGLSTLDVPWLVCWGVGFVDFDLDGDADVHVATHEQRDELLWQQRGGAFVPQYEVMARLGGPDARGTAYGDLDGDGDEDVVVARRGAGLQVLRNDTAAGVALVVEPRPLAAAPGARITVDAGGRRRTAVVQAGSSYLSTSPPAATFGLGGLTRAERVEVRFTDGAVVVVEGAPAGRVVVDHP